MAHFIGPAWGITGDPILVASLDGRRGRRKERHLQSTIPIIDDYGNAVAYLRRCTLCREYKPLQFDYFTTNPSAALGLSPICKTCSPLRVKAHMRASPEAVKRKRDRRRDRLQDPAEREKVRAHDRAYRERLKAQPERAAEIKERKRKAHERYASKPGVRERRNEAQRIAYRLRQERRGRDLSEMRQVPGVVDRHAAKVPRLAAAPVAALLQARVDVVIRREMMWSGDMGQIVSPQRRVCEAAGIAERQLLAWSKGEIVSIQFAVLDRILTSLGLEWWDVYDPADARQSVFSWRQRDDVLAWLSAAEAAATVFEGDVMRMAA